MADHSQQPGQDGNEPEQTAERLALIHAAMMVLLSFDFPNAEVEIVTDTRYRKSSVSREKILYPLKTEPRVFPSTRLMPSRRVVPIQVTPGLVSLAVFRWFEAANIA
jgi:hypothetical protein